jgi:hypothetical protein
MTIKAVVSEPVVMVGVLGRFDKGFVWKNDKELKEQKRLVS